MMESVRTSERLTRSVLLEIAKQEDPATQRQLLTQALHGQLTVKTLRQPRSTDHDSPPSSSTSIKLPDATITIRFHSAEHSQDSIRDALTEALASLTSST
jgi:hypothetical protein